MKLYLHNLPRGSQGGYSHGFARSVTHSKGGIYSENPIRGPIDFIASQVDQKNQLTRAENGQEGVKKHANSENADLDYRKRKDNDDGNIAAAAAIEASVSAQNAETAAGVATSESAAAENAAALSAQGTQTASQFSAIAESVAQSAENAANQALSAASSAEQSAGSAAGSASEASSNATSDYSR